MELQGFIHFHIFYLESCEYVWIICMFWIPMIPMISNITFGILGILWVYWILRIPKLHLLFFVIFWNNWKPWKRWNATDINDFKNFLWNHHMFFGIQLITQFKGFPKFPVMFFWIFCIFIILWFFECNEWQRFLTISRGIIWIFWIPRIPKFLWICVWFFVNSMNPLDLCNSHDFKISRFPLESLQSFESLAVQGFQQFYWCSFASLE